LEKNATVSEPTRKPASPTAGFIAGFYVVLAGVALVLAKFFGDLNVLVWHNVHDTPVYLDAIIGATVGVVVVGLSGVLDRYAEWSRELGREFGRTLGALSMPEAFIFALASGVGEELFFRGFLQQLLTEVAFSGPWADWAGLACASVIFGLLHIGPNLRKIWPWTLMAVVLGAVFGWMYLYTGNVLAPIIAHFTINFFNLQSIGRQYGHLKEDELQ
jgi:membrane protease YdiL (CAAX protease family)